MRERSISKVLSANDTGGTGAHQAGLLVPKEKEILSFFPKLDAAVRNPRAHLFFEDHAGSSWEFAFIYYNNKFFGGTRNEYRLTRMTRYIREAGLVAGDIVTLHHRENEGYSISYHRLCTAGSAQNIEGRTVLSLGSGWKVIDL